MDTGAFSGGSDFWIFCAERRSIRGLESSDCEAGGGGGRAGIPDFGGKDGVCDGAGGAFDKKGSPYDGIRLIGAACELCACDRRRVL